MKRSIPYGRQHIDEDDIKSVVESLGADFLTQGPRVLAFENEFAAYIGCRYAVAVSNGTAALHLACLALGVNDKSKVITTPITFAASGNCVAYCGGSVTFGDIKEDSALLDIESVRKILDASPAGTYEGVIPVDFTGHPVNLEEFRQLADEYGLWILEDACHAPGGYFTDSKGNPQNCGNGQFADLAIFSFHPVKHIACGEGGMITTNDEKLYQKLLRLRTHGITKDPALTNESHGGWFYDMIDLGYNYRITDMQCALGSTQLAKADKGLERRRAIAKKYEAAFKGSSVKYLAAPEDGGHAYHLFVILVNNRKEVYDKLREDGIYSQVHYIPMHLLEYYQTLGHRAGDFPVAENYYNQCLSLPMFPTLTDEEQDYVIEKVLSYGK